MTTKEYRIKLPFSLDDAHVGQQYTCWEMTREMAEVEIVHNTPFSGFKKYPGFERYNSGYYKYIKYKLRTKDMAERLPTWLKTLVPEVLIVHQETWNCYPNILTVTTIPGYMGKKFNIILESYYGGIDSPPSYKNYPMKFRENENTYDVINIDIVRDKVDFYEEDKDPTKYKCLSTGREPLTSGWQSGKGPFSMVYKLATVKCNLWLDFLHIAEKKIRNSMKNEINTFYRCMFCSSGVWSKLSIEDVMAMEEEEMKKHSEKLE